MIFCVSQLKGFIPHLWCRNMPQVLRHNSASMVCHNWLDLWPPSKGLIEPVVIGQLVRMMHLYTSNGKLYLRSRSPGALILENGTSSIFAHEQSTTATPNCSTICRSAGETAFSPTGLDGVSQRRLFSARCRDAYLATIPLNRWVTLSVLSILWRASLTPEHRLGSQCLKSYRHHQLRAMVWLA